MRNTFGENRLSGLMAILGLLSLLIGLIIIILVPAIKLAAWGILLLGVILLGAAFIRDYQRVGHAISGRRGRFGTAATVMVSIFIGIILLANAISLSSFHRFDLTGVSQFTLTSQTKDVLSKVETPITVLCFFTPQDPYGGLNSYITNLLTEYQNHSDQLSVKIIDPDEHPDQARQYGIQVYSTVVFESEKGQPLLVTPQEIIVTSGQQIVGAEAEHSFTSAILEITGFVQKKVYFLTGHGESDIYSDYSEARENLMDNLYQVEKLDLLQTHAIPEDLVVLVIAAPQRALNDEEANIIQNYLKSGGRVLIMLNPDSPVEVKRLLSPWGIDVEDGIVIDPSSYAAPNKDNLLVPRTRNFLALSSIYFPGATAIIPQPEYVAQIVGTADFVWASENTSIELYSILRASANSWLEKNFNTDEEPQFNEGIDREAPLHIGFIVTTSTSQEGEIPAEDEGTRLIVLGDSDFVSDQHFYNGNNGELFLNSINILSAGAELISIERKVLPFRRLVVGPEAITFIQYSSIFLLPLLILLIGGIMWWRRR
ncbi:GldG family protein [Chloroflexota bacterium]